jgi:hypothetical protein
VAQQQRQRGVLAQRRQILAALAARGPQAEQPSTSCEGPSPRLRRLITTLESNTAAAPLVRNASIKSGTPPCAVNAAVSARWSNSNGKRVCVHAQASPLAPDG